MFFRYTGITIAFLVCIFSYHLESAQDISKKSMFAQKLSTCQLQQKRIAEIVKSTRKAVDESEQNCRSIAKQPSKNYCVQSILHDYHFTSPTRFNPRLAPYCTDLDNTNQSLALLNQAQLAEKWDIFHKFKEYGCVSDLPVYDSQGNFIGLKTIYTHVDQTVTSPDKLRAQLESDQIKQSKKLQEAAHSWDMHVADKSLQLAVHEYEKKSLMLRILQHQEQNFALRVVSHNLSGPALKWAQAIRDRKRLQKEEEVQQAHEMTLMAAQDEDGLKIRKKEKSDRLAYEKKIKKLKQQSQAASKKEKELDFIQAAIAENLKTGHVSAAQLRPAAPLNFADKQLKRSVIEDFNIYHTGLNDLSGSVVDPQDALSKIKNSTARLFVWNEKLLAKGRYVSEFIPLSLYQDTRHAYNNLGQTVQDHSLSNIMMLRTMTLGSLERLDNKIVVMQKDIDHAQKSGNHSLRDELIVALEELQKIKKQNQFSLQSYIRLECRKEVHQVCAMLYAPGSVINPSYLSAGADQPETDTTKFDGSRFDKYFKQIKIAQTVAPEKIATYVEAMYNDIKKDLQILNLSKQNQSIVHDLISQEAVVMSGLWADKFLNIKSLLYDNKKMIAERLPDCSVEQVGILAHIQTKLIECYARLR